MDIFGGRANVITTVTISQNIPGYVGKKSFIIFSDHFVNELLNLNKKTHSSTGDMWYLYQKYHERYL